MMIRVQSQVGCPPIFPILRHLFHTTGRLNLLTVYLLILTLFVPLPGNADTDYKKSANSLFSHSVWKGDLDEMIKKREIRVLVTYSRTYFFVDKGRQRGLTYDLMKEFEEFVNQKIKSGTLKVKVIFIPVRRDQLISKLAEGYGDIAAANLTITDKRLEQVDFSNPFAKNVEEVVVTSTGEELMNDFDQLSGREVYIRKSSSYYQSLENINQLFVKTGRKPAKIIEADESLEDEDILEMLSAGIISTAIVDYHKAQLWEKVLDNIIIHRKAAIRWDGEIGWALRKNTPQLQKLVNEFVAKNRKGTLIGNLLINRYLKNTDFIKNPASSEELEKFLSIVTLFKKYAGIYRFDYIMIGAQAFQESGLDHSKKSKAGAVGIMQILPTTANDPNVGISDIHLLEQNIHAGVKYLRFLADRYYADEDMSEDNKMLFCFAAYNAGPGTIRKVRKRAKEMGFDPNIWFQNAEVAAAEIIGRETVQYVSNIYKYYIAYKLSIENLNERQVTLTRTREQSALNK